MRKLLIGLVVFLVLLVAATFLVPMFLPTGLIKEQVTKAVAAQTGRELAINGDVSIALFPSAKLKASDVTFANAPGGKAEHMASMGSLDVGLKLLPLLTRKVEITNFVLSEPEIHLEVDKSGKANWEFEGTDGAAAPGTDGTGPDAGTAGGSGVSNVMLGDVRIEKGRITYTNAQTGDAYDVTDMNAALRLPSLDKAFTFDGQATYNGETVDIKAEVARARALLEGGQTAIEADVKSAVTTFSFKGDADFAKQLGLTGAVDLDIPSVKKLAAWTGNPIAGADKGPGFGPAGLKGQVSAKGSTYSFSNAELRFDDIEATGEVQAVLDGAVPLITATLKTPMLDLRPYAGETGAGPAGKEGGGKESPAAANSGWSKEPMDVSALKSFNALLKFQAGGVRFQDLKIGASDIDMRVRGGVLTATLNKLDLYQGAGKGEIVLDGTRATPKLSSSLTLKGLALAPFLQDAAHTDRFEGIGSFTLNLTGTGRSQLDIIKSLGGTANIAFADGAVKGIDLNRVASIVNSLTGKAAESGEGTEEATGGDNKTKFVSLGGDFNIASGIVSTKNLKMINDVVSVSGSGTIDLPNQTLNLRLDPGQSQDDGGLKVALRITGPWAAPKVTPDASELLRNELKKKVGDSPAGAVLDQWLGGGDKMNEDGEAAEKPAPAKDLLNKLFK